MDRGAALAALGLQSNATAEQIKEAYRDLANVWHPDRFPGNARLQAKAGEELKKINAGYAFLRENPTPEAPPARRPAPEAPKPPPPPAQESAGPKPPPRAKTPEPPPQQEASKAEKKKSPPRANSAELRHRVQQLAEVSRRPTESGLPGALLSGVAGFGLLVFFAYVLPAFGTKYGSLFLAPVLVVGTALLVYASRSSARDEAAEKELATVLWRNEVECPDCGAGLAKAALEYARGEGRAKDAAFFVVRLRHQADVVLRDGACPKCKAQWW